MDFEVPESGDDLDAVVDGVAAAAALTEDLPVFEAADDVFDAGAEATVWRATMASSLRLPGQASPATITARLSAPMMIWVLMLRR